MASDLLIARLGALHAALRDVAPVHGVGFTDETASPPLVQVDYQDTAAPAQRVQGAAIVAAFDWSQTAQTAFDQEAGVRRSRGLLVENGIPNAALQAMTDVLADEINQLRAFVALPLHPLPEITAAMLAKITTGDVLVPAPPVTLLARLRQFFVG